MRNVEKYGPFLLALLAPAAYFFFWRQTNHAPSGSGLSALTEGVLNISGILIGFLATAKALLFAVPDRRAIRFIKQSGAFAGLTDYLFLDIIVWLVTAISALVLVFAGEEMVLGARRVLMGFWVYLPAAGLFAFWRSMYLFAKFLRLSAQVEDD